MKERPTLGIDMDMLQAEAHRAGVKIEEVPLSPGMPYESLSIIASNFIHPISAAHKIVDHMSNELGTNDILLHNYQVLPGEHVGSTQIYVTASARSKGVS